MKKRIIIWNRYGNEKLDMRSCKISPTGYNKYRRSTDVEINLQCDKTCDDKHDYNDNNNELQHNILVCLSDRGILELTP